MSRFERRDATVRRSGATRFAALCFALCTGFLAFATEGRAIEAIVVSPDQPRIDITSLAEVYEGRGDRLQIDTAPGPDGIIGRMAVQATTPGTDPGWIVFALTNPTSERVTRWLIAPRYMLTNSRVLWPELDTGRIATITPSLGFRPERLKSDRADTFRLSLEPGQTVTFAAEMSAHQIPRLTLWDPNTYQAKQQDRMLFNGVLLGITGLLAIFLTAIFAANHRAVFPATALVAWSALAYFCVDFGFWSKLFPVELHLTALYRAASEAMLAASVVLFLYVFLRIGLWHGWIRTVFWGWIAAQFALVAIALVDPPLASGLARTSTLIIAGVGTCLVTYLALRGQDRALLLVPSWLLLLAWLFAAAMIVLGNLSGDFVVSGLSAGLVLILVLLGFTVTQFAFQTPGALPAGPVGHTHLKSLAVDGSGAAVWQWNASKDHISVANQVEEALGVPPGTLETSVDRFLQYMHASDRERFRMMLWSLQEKKGGDLQTEFRLKRQDGSYLWYELRAHATPSENTRLLRCVGLMRDITSLKRSHERLMQDAVHDSLTGLPNRELFIDRLQGAMTRAREGAGNRPTVMFIDIDRFKNVNKSFGLSIADSMLLTVARRLARHLNPQDTLARLVGDQFALLMISETDPRQIAMLAERVRRALRTPMKLSGKEIVLTASVGIVVDDGVQPAAVDVLREAEIAMLRAKREGADRIEIFSASMRGEDEGRFPLEADLKKALERGQIDVLYQPITRLASNQLAGFEALLRWEHPTRGMLTADEFLPIAEDTGLIGDLGTYVFGKALTEAARWHRMLPRERDSLFVSVNVTSRQLFRHDLVQEIRLILAREVVPKGTLKLEISETIVMENPERTVEILNWLKGFGAGLALDEFGTGSCSLSYLHRFPVELIKVDRTLVRERSVDGTGPLVLRSVIALAHELGRAVIAEGVESVEDANYLRSIGCEYGQGFYYGEPMPPKEVEELLTALASHRRRVQHERARSPHQPPQMTTAAPVAAAVAPAAAPAASTSGVT